jgi:hypothetical protein
MGIGLAARAQEGQWLRDCGRRFLCVLSSIIDTPAAYFYQT